MSVCVVGCKAAVLCRTPARTAPAPAAAAPPRPSLRPGAPAPAVHLPLAQHAQAARDLLVVLLAGVGQHVVAPRRRLGHLVCGRGQRGRVEGGRLGAWEAGGPAARAAAASRGATAARARPGAGGRHTTGGPATARHAKAATRRSPTPSSGCAAASSASNIWRYLRQAGRRVRGEGLATLKPIMSSVCMPRSRSPQPVRPSSQRPPQERGPQMLVPPPVKRPPVLLQVSQVHRLPGHVLCGTRDRGVREYQMTGDGLDGLRRAWSGAGGAGGAAPCLRRLESEGQRGAAARRSTAAIFFNLASLAAQRKG